MGLISAAARKYAIRISSVDRLTGLVLAALCISWLLSTVIAMLSIAVILHLNLY